jgi:MFS superfamily sulfate permease-like transporter
MTRPRPATRPDARPPLYLRRPLLAGFLRQWPLLSCIVTVAAGLLLVAAERWRVGLVLTGLALVLAGAFRLLLPVRRIGFLAVRSRPVDITLMLGAGVVLVVCVLAIPHT